MKKWIIISAVLAVLLCTAGIYAVSRPGAQPELRLSDEPAPNGPIADYFLPTGRADSHRALQDMDAFITGEVLSYEIILFDASGYNIPEPEVWVAFIVEVKETLFGEFKPGEKIYCCRRVYLWEGTAHLDQNALSFGSFFKPGEQVLLPVKKSEPEWTRHCHGQRESYVFCTPAHPGLVQNVDADGTLSRRDGNRYGKTASFTQFSTVQALRAGLPEIFTAYREEYSKDHPGVFTYRADATAAPGLPEGYVRCTESQSLSD